MKRTLLSVILAAALLAAELVLLTSLLNPAVSLKADGLALAVALFLPYLVLSTLAFSLLVLMAAAIRFWPKTARPPIEGLPWFTPLALVATTTAGLLFWHNLLSYRHSIPVENLRALVACALSLGGAALLLLAVGIDALLFPLRGRGLSAPLVVLAAASGVVVPLAVRPAPRPSERPVPLATETVAPVRRVILVGVDGLGPEQVRHGVARGNLPSFARLLKRGASGPLATLRPTEGPPIWTTIVTGCLPRNHGVKSFATYRLRGSDSVFELLPKGALVALLERAGLVSRSPVTAASRKRRALWNALNAFGVSTGVVRFWGTYPPEHVRGFMLSHYFHLLRGDPQRAGESLYPPDLLAEVSARAVEPADVDAATIAQFVDLSAEAPGDRIPWRRDLVERALAPDLTYQRAGSVLRAAYDPAFFGTYFYGLDVVGHGFLRFALPERFGDVRPEEVRRYGKVLDRYTAQLGQWLGDLAQGLRPGEILLVVSGYGMEPVPLWRRLLAGLGGDPATSGTHEGAPDGFLMAVGDGVRPGAALGSASVLDVAPTVLYLMGLPVARDMEGRVLTEIVEEDFTRAHPVTFVPSYESLAVAPVAEPLDLDLPPLPDEGS